MVKVIIRNWNAENGRFCFINQILFPFVWEKRAYKYVKDQMEALHCKRGRPREREVPNQRH